MAGQSVRKFKGKTLEFSPGTEISADFSLGMIYRYIDIELTGQLDLDGADNTTANLALGDELALIRRLKLIRNNTTVIRNFRGAQLRPLMHLNPQKGGRYPSLSSELGDGNADPNFSAKISIPMESIWTGKPADTWIDSSKLQNLTIEVNWGTATDINSNANGFVETPRVQVSKRAVSAGYQPKGGFDRRKVLEKRGSIDQATDNHQINFPVGGDVYAGFYLRQIVDGEDNPNIVNNFKLTSGGTTFVNVDADVLRESYRHNFGITNDMAERSDKFDGDAHLVYLHPTDGRLSEALATENLSELTMELDVSTPGTDNELQIQALRYQLVNPSLAGDGSGQ